ncbi:putative transcription factor C2H2 family [Rosa chinensis]|uniref:RING-type E3 ubiquitin transferase n=1 Tax=Rosa chinensis TaxID=74649 RepID=A0A2P6S4V3_ROSCH|nr:putative RING-H2 finger protein ATL12 [Rosa chinensis]PRQ53710.1 putative transcription factor C2H2 family [Rosa chinensis]
MIRHLSRIGIPQEEQPTILDKLFGVLRTAFPEGRILVLIAQVTLRLLGSFDDLDTISAVICRSPNFTFGLEYWVPDEVRCETHTVSGVDYHGTTTPIDRLLLESFEALPRIVRFIPATRSSIESLQKVRLDSLEAATIKQNPSCNICRDDFAEGSADQLVTPLPCAHCYHADCFIMWLEVNHLCPLCRYAMPNVEEGQSSSS